MTPVVALTGGIASGKSAAASRFETHGIQVTDADAIAAQILSPGSDALDQIRETFGDQSLTPNGEYNRPWMRELVFGQPDQLQVLNSIVHPAVRAHTQIALAKPKTQPYQIWMIPLLVETGQADQADRVVVVDVTRETQLSRLLDRDGVTPESAERTLAAQASRSERQAVADYLIHNEGSLEVLYGQVDSLHQRLSKEFS
jgi:dephospho-CoA kinase